MATSNESTMGEGGEDRKKVVVTSTSVSKNEALLYEDEESVSTCCSPGRSLDVKDQQQETQERSIKEEGDGGGEELPVKVPIVGFETMEERAKFTVFKLRVENEKLNESWLVFRRYTDFVRLHSKLKDEVQNLQINLPPKRWLRDNFETAFLEERMKGLQAFVDSILVQPLLAQLSTVRKFFCLDEPPSLESADDSRSWNGSIEENCMLKQRLIDREREIELLRAELALVLTQKDNLQKIIRHCKPCNQKAASMSSPYGRILANSSPFTVLPSSSSSSDHGSPRRISYVDSNVSPIHHTKRRNNSESSIKSNLRSSKNGERVNGIPDSSSVASSDSSQPCLIEPNDPNETIVESLKREECVSSS